MFYCDACTIYYLFEENNKIDIFSALSVGSVLYPKWIFNIKATSRSNQKVLIEGIDTEFEVMAVTPQTPNCLTPLQKCHHEVSISILSWYHKMKFKLGVIVKPNCLSVVQI